MIGVGLVSLQSALGQHEQPGRCLALAPQNQWIAPGMNHMELLSQPEVDAAIGGVAGVSGCILPRIFGVLNRRLPARKTFKSRCRADQ